MLAAKAALQRTSMFHPQKMPVKQAFFMWNDLVFDFIFLLLFIFNFTMQKL